MTTSPPIMPIPKKLAEVSPFTRLFPALPPFLPFLLFAFSLSSTLDDPLEGSGTRLR